MRRLLSQALSLVFLLAATSTVGAAQTVANDVVESLHDSLIAVMKNADTLGFEGRRDRLAPVIANSFDMALIARGSTGRHWRTFDAEQQKRLVEKLINLTVATYASRFDDYAGEKSGAVDPAKKKPAEDVVGKVIEPVAHGAGNSRKG